MDAETDRGFDEYWTDRIPGLKEYAHVVLTSDNDFRNTLHIFLTNSNPCKVLDAGTGIGVAAIEMARMGFEVTAIDRNGHLIDAAKEVAKEFDVQVDFRVGDLYQPAFEDKSFDIIVVRNCLWNLTEPEKAMFNLRKLLKTGG